MKKILSSLLSIIILAASTLQTLPVVAAEESEPGILSFADLGLNDDMVLRGPYDSRDIRFNLPATWELLPGAELQIEVTAFSVGIGDQVKDDFLGAILSVSFNDQLQQSIPLVSGERTIYTVPITTEDLVSTFKGGWHKISFFLDAAVDCNYDFHETTVIIDVNSRVNFPHGETSIALDLKRLPWPIFMERGKIIDPVTLVLPADPTAEELQAGLVVMGAFGRMTNGELPITSLTEDLLTEEILNQTHLLVVGKPSEFPIFTNLPYPIPLGAGIFSHPEINPDDGIIQILTSPWNSSRVILFVGGNNDQAVVKAAQALSTANLQTGLTPDYSIVSQVNPFPSTVVTSTTSVSSDLKDYFFTDLGYSFVDVTGIGTHWLTYEFMIPPGQTPTEDVYLDLNISTSDLVNPRSSEGVVYLNDIQIGSIALSSDTSNLVTSRIDIPLSVLKSGLNVLDLALYLLPVDECSLYNLQGLWITVYPDSVLHMPLVPSSVLAVPYTLQDLKSYPSPFGNDPSLGTTSFILTKDDPNSWEMAGRVAFDLGKQVTSSVLGFHVVFDGQIPEEIKTNNLIVIGEPKNLAIVSELKDAMPAYYEAGSNVAVLATQQVIYRISAEKSLGYLQLFSNPWNDQAVILGIFGTNTEGLGFATSSLLTAESRDTLAGNFATLEGLHALVVDTRTGMGVGRITPGLGPAVTEENPPSPEPTSGVETNYSVSRQVVFAGILIVLGLIAITIVVIFLVRRKNS